MKIKTSFVSNSSSCSFVIMNTSSLPLTLATAAEEIVTNIEKLNTYLETRDNLETIGTEEDQRIVMEAHLTNFLLLIAGGKTTLDPNDPMPFTAGVGEGRIEGMFYSIPLTKTKNLLLKPGNV